MPFPIERQQKPVTEGRLATTAVIWGCATGMLAICLPLSNAPHHGSQGTIVSLAILIAATICSLSIWKRANPSAQSSEVSEQMKQLQERIMNLEAIASSENLDWRQSIQPSIRPDLTLQDSLDSTES